MRSALAHFANSRVLIFTTTNSVLTCPHKVCFVLKCVGTRETAFLRAIINAGVVYAVTMACSAGNLSDCACAQDPSGGPYAMMADQQMPIGAGGMRSAGGFRSAPVGAAGMGQVPGARTANGARFGQVSGSGTGSGPAFTLATDQQQAGAGGGAEQQQQNGVQQQESHYVWSGCSDNIAYGVRLAEQFVDSAEDGLLETLDGAILEPSEIPVPRRVRRLINLHNNKVGRRVHYCRFHL